MGWITTILTAVQDWVRFERLNETDGGITAPNEFETSVFEFPADKSVGRKLWVKEVNTGNLHGPFTITVRQGASVVTVEPNWPDSLVTYSVGGPITYTLQTWFAAQMRRMDFVTADPGTRPIANPAGVDMPLLVMAPTIGESPIEQFTNLQVSIDLSLQWELWAPGPHLDKCSDLLGELIDLLLAGRINRSGVANRPFRIIDSTTGYQRMTFGPTEFREAADYDTHGIAKNHRFRGTLETSCLILRRQP